MPWYLCSIGDHDTHRGELLHPDGTVTVACGIRFRPHPLLHSAIAPRSGPPDPDQICLACRRSGSVQ